MSICMYTHIIMRNCFPINDVLCTSKGPPTMAFWAAVETPPHLLLVPPNLAKAMATSLLETPVLVPGERGLLDLLMVSLLDIPVLVPQEQDIETTCRPDKCLPQPKKKGCEPYPQISVPHFTAPSPNHRHWWCVPTVCSSRSFRAPTRW